MKLIMESFQIAKDLKDLVDEFRADVTGETFRRGFNEE